MTEQADSQRSRYNEAMAAAREAADQAGVSLEDWLSRTIIENATNAGLVAADGVLGAQNSADQYQTMASNLEKAQVAADAAGVPVAEWLTQAILENTAGTNGAAAPEQPAEEPQAAPQHFEPAPVETPTEQPAAIDQANGNFYAPPQIDVDPTAAFLDEAAGAPPVHPNPQPTLPVAATVPDPEPAEEPGEPYYQAPPFVEPEPVPANPAEPAGSNDRAFDIIEKVRGLVEERADSGEAQAEEAVPGTESPHMEDHSYSDHHGDPGAADQAAVFEPAAAEAPDQPAAATFAEPAPAEPTRFGATGPLPEHAPQAEQPQDRLAQIIASTREEMSKRNQVDSATQTSGAKNALMVLPQKGSKKGDKASSGPPWLMIGLLVLLVLMVAAIWIVPGLSDAGPSGDRAGKPAPAPQVAVAKPGVKSGNTVEPNTPSPNKAPAAADPTKKPAGAAAAAVAQPPQPGAPRPANAGDVDGAPATAAPTKPAPERMPQPAGKHVEWYKSAAKAGDLKAQVKLAELYLRGDGVTRDYKKAAELFRKAAQEGSDPKAQYALGVLYQRGLGVRKDLHNAVLWYERAARQGHVGATYNAGEAYALGIGVKRDFVKARLFFLRAAEAADAESQYRMGELYEKGLGVEKDIVVAFKWYTLAGQQGFKKGGDAAERLIPEMTEDQRNQASELILEHNQRFKKKQ